MLGKLFLATTGSTIEVMEIDLGTGLLYSVLGICIVFVALLSLMIVIKIMGAINSKSTGETKTESKPAAPAPTPAPAPAPTPAAPAPVAAASGEAPDDLGPYTVPVKTAAMIMAIVADEMGCEPNELSFKSIKRQSDHPVVDGCELIGVPDEKTAAMVMAVVADAMGCEPAELCFNSIKRV